MNANANSTAECSYKTKWPTVIKVQSLVTIGIGMLCHIFKISLINMKLQRNQDYDFEPNTSSCIFAMSTLCFLLHSQSQWFVWMNLKRPLPKFMEFVFYFLITLYVNELSLRFLWMPFSRILYWIFIVFGDRIETIIQRTFYKKNYEEAELKGQSIRVGVMFFIRYLCSLWLFYIMLDCLGFNEFVVGLFDEKRKRQKSTSIQMTVTTPIEKTNLIEVKRKNEKEINIVLKL